MTQLTENAHDVLALSDLPSDLLISFLESTLLLLIYIDGPLVYRVDDRLHFLHAFVWDELDDLPPERGAAPVGYVWQQAAPEGESDNGRPM